jgi:pimeloyl-ACP methyl ester carboxylesterase
VEAPGVDVELHDLGGDGPPLLICHATGFCGRTYEPMARYLTGRFHVWAVDFRAHGASPSPPDGDLDWGRMADDLLACVEALGGGPIRLFGHSMGGATILLAERRRPGTVAWAYLFEPIVVPAEVDTTNGNHLADTSRRRRPTFPSREAALLRYATGPALGTLRADSLAAYVQHGFVDAPDGTVTLACTPQDEAGTFEATGKPTPVDLQGLPGRFTVAVGLRGADLGPARYAPAVVEALATATLVEHRHLGHFGPLEDPDTIAEEILAMELDAG